MPHLLITLNRLNSGLADKRPNVKKKGEKKEEKLFLL